MLTRPVAVGAARAAALAVLPRRPGRDRQQAVVQVPVRGLAQLLAGDPRLRRCLIVIPIAVRVGDRRCSRLAIIAAAIGCGERGGPPSLIAWAPGGWSLAGRIVPSVPSSAASPASGDAASFFA